ncbi:MAG: family 43 glycosylhydrolase [Acidimicrobiia bacterium]|nr:family 43 glycosylhydrolase [Acidimicrobiia bacterium]
MKITTRGRFVALALAAVLALGTTLWHVNHAWTQRRHAMEALGSARASVGAAKDTLATERARFGRDRANATTVRRRRDLAAESLELRNAQLVATEADRDRARTTRDTKNAEALIVRACLDGARTALGALRLHDNARTVAALQSVDAVCRAAQGNQSGPTAQYAFDFPDPFVLTVGTEEYAFATNSGGGNIQGLKRKPDGTWATNGDALGQFPAWASWGRTWAPSVLPRLSGFVMYYTVREASTGRQCISRALSTAPGGPYVDTSTAPLQCSERDAIDAEPVVGLDGAPVLLWKYERPATIVARPLRPDGMEFAGPEVTLLSPSRGWVGTNVEAPSMLVTPTGSWLFFSANDWRTRRYTTGVVRCAGPLGPCDPPGAAPLLATHSDIVGPGGGSVFRDPTGTIHLAYHAYREPNVGYPANRLFFTARVDLTSGRPVLVE